MRGLLLSIILCPLLLALSPGQSAPNFTAKNQDGKEVHLSDFEGKFLLIYFYPKDDTPGCTKEACTLRDRFPSFKDVNAVVLGVSRQDSTSHRKFRDKHHLPFDLLVDSDGKLSEAFQVESMPIIGLTKRQSILISPKGKIIQFYKDVDPKGHADQVLKDIAAAK